MVGSTDARIILNVNLKHNSYENDCYISFIGSGGRDALEIKN